MRRKLIRPVACRFLFGFVLLGIGCGQDDGRALTAEEGKKLNEQAANEKTIEEGKKMNEQTVNKKTIQLTSTAFNNNTTVPTEHTCEGKDASPALKWSGVPEGTKSIALICDDPDAPVGTWVHWVIYNIPADAVELPEGVPTDQTLRNGAIQGTNDFKKIGYGGPCPPKGHGPHRYFFKLYALDAAVSLKPGATKQQLEDAMKGHILAKGQLMGKYERK